MSKVFCICLSNGNASGLGQTRAKELKKSTLEVFKLDGCVIADSEDLQDGMENAWPLEEIAKRGAVRATLLAGCYIDV